jgi:hypothetical protein
MQNILPIHWPEAYSFIRLVGDYPSHTGLDNFLQSIEYLLNMLSSPLRVYQGEMFYRLLLLRCKAGAEIQRIGYRNKAHARATMGAS